jgi:hypothetical protein
MDGLSDAHGLGRTVALDDGIHATGDVIHRGKGGAELFDPLGLARGSGPY